MVGEDGLDNTDTKTTGPQLLIPAAHLEFFLCVLPIPIPFIMVSIPWEIHDYVFISYHGSKNLRDYTKILLT